MLSPTTNADYAGKLCCILNGLLDIFAFKTRVSLKDLLETGAVRNLAKR
jgi:hypothetical protein